MSTWSERPVEVANLLNPAFCGQVIYSCAVAHQDEREDAFPYALAFLVLPLVLHSDTRGTMKATTRHFEVWLNVNPEIKVGLADRARSLVPFGREALTFLQQCRAFQIRETDAAIVISKGLRRIRRRFPPGEDTKACLAGAGILGKWFARENSPAAVYAALGLRP